jgi:hypothetical protein
VTLLNPPQLETFVSEWDSAAAVPEFSHLKESRVIRDVAESYSHRQLYLRFLGE